MSAAAVDLRAVPAQHPCQPFLAAKLRERSHFSSQHAAVRVPASLPERISPALRPGASPLERTSAAVVSAGADIAVIEASAGSLDLAVVEDAAAAAVAWSTRLEDVVASVARATMAERIDERIADQLVADLSRVGQGERRRAMRP